jgi:ParB family transcriptional regulator, chromosome partitioning protein
MLLSGERDSIREADMLQQTTKLVIWLKPDPKQPRKTFDEPELDRLGADMVFRGVLVPLLVKPDGVIIDGERRWRAAQRKGIKELPVIITEKALPEDELLGIQIATAFHRADLNGHDRWQALERLRELNSGWQSKEVAEFLHIDASMVTRLGSPSKCIPAWQEALAAGNVGISDCYAASKLDPSEQAKLLAMKLAGASRDQIEQAGRNTRKGGKEAVRMSRVKIAMPQGSMVVVSGADLGMSELVELLTQTLSAARKAAEQYDVKTFQSMMRDRAKAG